MNRRYFLSFIIIIAIVVAAFVVASLAIGGGSSKSDSNSAINLADYASTSKSVKLSIGGNLRSDSEYREFDITVSQNRTSIDVIGGYQGNVLETKSYENNQSAYRNFLAALQRAGFTKGSDNDKDGNVEGACASGRRFVLEIMDGNQVEQNYWTSSCKTGNFEGKIDQIITLFQWQVPDYSAITGKYSL